MLRNSTLSPLFTWLLCASAALACAFSSPGRTQEIYSAVVAVSSRDAGVLRNARRAGLDEVIVKASGEANARERPAIRKALGQAQSYLLGYSYEESDDAQLFVRFDFDERAVQGLLRDAELPLWTVNRPTVIAWLVVSDGRERRFVSPDAAPAEYTALKTSFDKRGVALQVPLYDLRDSAMLTPGAAWRQSSSSLIEASSRYRDRELLAGRVAHLSDGSWIGDWRYFDQGRWVTRRASEASPEAFMDVGADLVAQTLARRYAVNVQQGGDQRHLVSFRGVRSYRDFRALQDALMNLEAVQRVVPERLLGDSLSLRVDADADVAQLSRIIELDRRFVPTPAPAGEAGLHYEWIE